MFSQVLQVVPWYLSFRFGRGTDVPRPGICIPWEIQIYFKNMGFDLEFQRKHFAILDFVFFYIYLVLF